MGQFAYHIVRNKVENVYTYSLVDIGMLMMLQTSEITMPNIRCNEQGMPNPFEIRSGQHVRSLRNFHLSANLLCLYNLQTLQVTSKKFSAL